MAWAVRLCCQWYGLRLLIFFFYWKVMAMWAWTDMEIKKIQARSRSPFGELTMFIDLVSSPMLI